MGGVWVAVVVRRRFSVAGVVVVAGQCFVSLNGGAVFVLNGGVVSR
ncbi:hypothetical protein [Kitasatospora kazusensis]